MEEITVFTVVITATYVCEARDTQQANSRADEYWASHLDEATHLTSSAKAYKEEEGD